MKKYSVVIPVFKRFKELKTTLKSIINQSYLPNEIIIVNNNTNRDEFNILKSYVIKLNHPSLKITHLDSHINSGAVARNIGAKYSNTEIVAFIDSDVILDKNYAVNIIKKFESSDDIIAIQGVDVNLQNYYLSLKNSFLNKFIYSFEYLFQTSSFFKKGKGRVMPSLAVTHPNPPFNFDTESEWISTCAGFFKRDIFKKYQFCNQFVTYSWNEYIYLSYSLFKDKVGKMIYFSDAKYKGIITSKGRINYKELQYMGETYDLYIFCKLFKKNIYNIFLFSLSRLGRILFYYLKLLRYPKACNGNLVLPISALIYALKHINNIKNNDLSFYKKDFY